MKVFGLTGGIAVEVTESFATNPIAELLAEAQSTTATEI